MQTKTEDRFVIAIDPGFTCTGIVLVRYNEDYTELVNFAYVLEPPNMKGQSECARVFNMADKIVDTLIKVTSPYVTQNNWSVGIEYIYYNRKNPKSLIMQSRLLQAIEHLILNTINIDNENFILLEHNPNTVKKTMRKGKSTKDEIRKSVIDKVRIGNTILESINLLSKPAAEAIYDAAAIAYTHVKVLEEFISDQQ